MGKKKKDKKLEKEHKKTPHASGVEFPSDVKSKCCKKYKKSAKKRCKKCPCFDLIKQVA